MADQADAPGDESTVRTTAPAYASKIRAFGSVASALTSAPSHHQRQLGSTPGTHDDDLEGSAGRWTPANAPLAIAMTIGAIHSLAVTLLPGLRLAGHPAARRRT